MAQPIPCAATAAPASQGSPAAPAPSSSLGSARSSPSLHSPQPHAAALAMPTAGSLPRRPAPAMLDSAIASPAHSSLASPSSSVAASDPSPPPPLASSLPPAAPRGPSLAERRRQSRSLSLSLPASPVAMRDPTDAHAAVSPSLHPPSCIAKNLYLGSQHSLRYLRAGAPPHLPHPPQRIAVLNVAEELAPLSPRAAAAAQVPHGCYMHEPMSHAPQLHVHLPRALQFIDAHLQQGTPVLVHCMCGVSRSAAVVIAYLMRALNWSFRAAYEHVAARRKIAPNMNLVYQLVEFGIALGTDEGAPGGGGEQGSTVPAQGVPAMHLPTHKLQLTPLPPATSSLDASSTSTSGNASTSAGDAARAARAVAAATAVVHARRAGHSAASSAAASPAPSAAASPTSASSFRTAFTSLTAPATPADALDAAFTQAAAAASPAPGGAQWDAAVGRPQGDAGAYAAGGGPGLLAAAVSRLAPVAEVASPTPPGPRVLGAGASPPSAGGAAAWTAPHLRGLGQPIGLAPAPPAPVASAAPSVSVQHDLLATTGLFPLSDPDLMATMRDAPTAADGSAAGGLTTVALLRGDGASGAGGMGRPRSRSNPVLPMRRPSALFLTTPGGAGVPAMPAMRPRVVELSAPGMDDDAMMPPPSPTVAVGFAVESSAPPVPPVPMLAQLGGTGGLKARRAQVAPPPRILTQFAPGALPPRERESVGFHALASPAVHVPHALPHAGADHMPLLEIPHNAAGDGGGLSVSGPGTPTVAGFAEAMAAPGAPPHLRSVSAPGLPRVGGLGGRRPSLLMQATTLHAYDLDVAPLPSPRFAPSEECATPTFGSFSFDTRPYAAAAAASPAPPAAPCSVALPQSPAVQQFVEDPMDVDAVASSAP